MLIKECKGYELEKAQSNSPEDFFNRSEVTYVENGKEKTLHILYVRFFEEQLDQITAYNDEVLFTAGNREIFFRDIVGLVCLIKKPEFRERKRVYMNNVKEFLSYFKDIDYSKLPQLFENLNKSGYELKSPLELISQPSL